jgi:type I restriction enzyme S subunit
MAQLGKDMAFNQTCYCLLPNNGLDKNYLYYSMLFSVNSIIAMSYGTIFGTITTNSFRDWHIPLPPLAEQAAIAKALSDADSLIVTLEQLIAKKRQVQQGAMQELLTGKRRLPGFSREWEVRTIAQIAPLQRGFDLPSSKLRDGIYPVVYSNGIMNYHESFMVHGPGVVTGRSGTLGKIHYVEEDYWPHNTSLWVTRFDGNSSKFIYYLYTFIGFERFGSGSGVPTLNRNDAHEFRVYFPPSPAEQTAIAEILSDMDAEIAALEGKLSKAREVKQGMMQELLTGRVRLV